MLCVFNPNNLGHVWLLEIAAMASSQHLINYLSPSVFRISQYLCSLTLIKPVFPTIFLSCSLSILKGLYTFPYNKLVRQSACLLGKDCQGNIENIEA